jgi:hypothetical protein
MNLYYSTLNAHHIKSRWIIPHFTLLRGISFEHWLRLTWGRLIHLCLFHFHSILIIIALNNEIRFFKLRRPVHHFFHLRIIFLASSISESSTSLSKLMLTNFLYFGFFFFYIHLFFYSQIFNVFIWNLLLNLEEPFLAYVFQYILKNCPPLNNPLIL